MGFLDRLLGKDEPTKAQDFDRYRSGGDPVPAARPGAAMDPDAQALERYRYMIRTAPPETVEQAHAEAFSKLTPDQRRQVLGELAQAAPAAERAAVAATSSEDPRALARIATRAEVRQPGIMERVMGGPGLGLGASLLSSFAMGFVGSMVAQSFFSALGGFGGDSTDADLMSRDTTPDEGVQDDAGDQSDFGSDADLGDTDFGDFEV